jgi:hypothetical protein
MKKYEVLLCSRDPVEIVGVTREEEVVELVKRSVAREIRRELSQLDSPVHLVPEPKPEPDTVEAAAKLMASLGRLGYETVIFALREAIFIMKLHRENALRPAGRKVLDGDVELAVAGIDHFTLLLEREEEMLIEEAERNGIEIDGRADADPRAILGLV